MGHRKVIENYYTDISNLADLLTKLVNSYRLLIGGANELNGIALASKKDIKAAIKRSHELGEIIDNLLVILKESSSGYIDYCDLKSQVMKSQMQFQYIKNEIDNELKLQD
ncbi:hypothetical protein IAI10_17800 [Clostridium sp. 19966]|uniref:hypothetical protein n=1 Tax=Clostridium sp. 19966 TaxID=2768166 RepID=UPI0028DEE4C1|nr:hypothetical protein [Clostridium sp. 19966]MDT8718522.1 hypothetical protein [Clostridium sp. 19966]